MKPVYENIEVDLNTSLKVASYTYEDTCGLLNWHIHPEYEIVYIKNGKGYLQIGSKLVSYNHGLLIFLKGNIPHTNMGNKDFKDNIEVVMQFKKELISDKLRLFPEFSCIADFIKNADPVLVYKDGFKNLLSKEFESLRNANRSQKLITTLSVLEKMCKNKDYDIIIEGQIHDNPSDKSSHRLEKVFNYINLNFCEPISVEKIAAHIGLTPNSFCRFFKKMTSKTFIQFLNDFRIGKAIELIHQRDKNLIEVMYDCGFQDQSYFGKIFKKKQGMTPSGYVKYLNTKKRL